MYKTHFSKEKLLTLDEALKKRREQRKRAVENARAKKADPPPRKQKKTPSNRKAISAEQMYILRNLFRHPGISAMDLLRAIRPRAGTYLGLPRDTVTPQPELGFFAKALEQGLKHSMTVKHNCRNRDSRKELTLLAAVLVPPGWHIQLKMDVLLIHPPADVSVIKEMLQKEFKHNFVEWEKESN